jgi:nicotinamide-nucleotide amidase
LKARFAKRGIEFSANNARQALVPRGAEVVHNPVGTAPMFIQQIGKCTAFFVPGVPREYRTLVDKEVLPRLVKMIERQPNRLFRASRVLKTVGLPESHLDRMVEPLAKLHPKVYFGFRTRAPENHLRLLAEGDSALAAAQALAAAEQECRKVLGQFVFGADEDSFAGVIGSLLRARKSTLALAESCTGGLAAELITGEPGASDYFLGSAVTYADAMKERWAQVNVDLLSRFGAVSKEVALSMAEGIRRECGSTYGVAITGFAGPSGGNPQDPVGTVYCAVAWPEGSDCQRAMLLGDRSRVREFAAYHALEMLRRRLLQL